MTTPEHITCKVCGQDAAYLCDTSNEHSETRILHHYRCSNCGLVFVGNKIENEELGIAYSTLDQGAYYDEIKIETGKKFESSIRDLDELTGKDSAIIDIGTGNGGFMEKLLQNGFTRVAGHEIPGADLQQFEEAGCTLYYDFDYQSIPSNHFDVVTLLDVAEHVLDPRYLFETCSRILKPGGIAYFHTPVVAKTDKMMHLTQKLPGLNKLGQVWQRGRTSIFHQQNYTAKSIEILLHETGFESVNIIEKNELSWPVSMYVRIYLSSKYGLPNFTAPLLAPFFYPFLATDYFNSNKAIVWAKKRG